MCLGFLKCIHKLIQVGNYSDRQRVKFTPVGYLCLIQGLNEAQKLMKDRKSFNMEDKALEVKDG